MAQRGKTNIGWFYGFKVHRAINDCGELFGVVITPGNVDDRKAAPGDAILQSWKKLLHLNKTSFILHLPQISSS